MGPEAFLEVGRNFGDYFLGDVKEQHTRTFVKKNKNKDLINWVG